MLVSLAIFECFPVHTDTVPSPVTGYHPESWKSSPGVSERSPILGCSSSFIIRGWPGSSKHAATALVSEGFDFVHIDDADAWRGVLCSKPRDR